MMRGFRTDKNGRWSPAHNLFDADDAWVAEICGGIAVGFGLAFALYLFI